MIKYLVMDVDGTLTDGKIYMGIDGEVLKTFSVKDGLGIKDLLIPTGVVPIIITGRQSQILLNRCKELTITEVHQKVSDKVSLLEKIVEKRGAKLCEFAYVGDDLNDLLCMKKIKEGGGLIGCPSDSCKEVIALADFVSSRVGGNGAVREFIDYILELNKK